LVWAEGIFVGYPQPDDTISCEGGQHQIIIVPGKS
jgi:hypothetical protein